MTEKVLSFDQSVTPQEQSWDCGPASTQVVLNGLGIVMSENDLISRIGTTVNGTDYVGLIQNVLNDLVPGANYTSVYFDGENLPTPVQSDQLWTNVVGSINSGHGVVFNWDAPPDNYPVGVKGSVSPSYGGGEVMHYVACMGYDDTPGARALWIADPGFSPFEYWISFDQAASLIPPKGYAYATATAPVVPVPAPTPAPAANTALFGVDLSNNNWGGQPAANIVPILNQIAAEGFSWVAHKVSEGNYYSDPYWPTVWQWHVDTGNRVIAYHYVTTDPAESQAQTYLANDPSNGKAPCFLDFEANSGDITNYRAVYNAFIAAGINLRLEYIPYWYWEQIGSPSLAGVTGLISSSYVSGSGYASVLYPGSDWAGWDAYGGVTPAICQFTDAANVAGMSMDANAFRGSLDDLDALLGNTTTSGGIFMALTDQQQADLYNAIMGIAALVSDNNTQLRGPNQQGWPELGMRADGMSYRTPVDALAHQLGDPHA